MVRKFLLEVDNWVYVMFITIIHTCKLCSITVVVSADDIITLTKYS